MCRSAEPSEAFPPTRRSRRKWSSLEIRPHPILEATAHLYQITLEEYDTSFVVHGSPQALNSSRPKVSIVW